MDQVEKLPLCTGPGFSDSTPGTRPGHRNLWTCCLDPGRHSPLAGISSKRVSKVIDQTLYFFPVPDAYLAFLGEPNGYRSTGNGLFFGENRKQGALLTFYLKELGEEKKATVQIYNQENQLIRTFKTDVQKGSNRIAWDLRRKGVATPSLEPPKKDAAEPRGHSVSPGVYTVQLTYADEEAKQTVKVIADPALPVTQEQMVAKAQLFAKHYQNVAAFGAKMKQLGKVKDLAELVKGQLSKQDGQEALIKNSESLLKKMEEIVEKVRGPKDVQGLYRDPNLLFSKQRAADRSLQDIIYPVTETNKNLVQAFEEAMQPVVQEIDDFLQNDWGGFRQALDAGNFNLFSGF